MPFADGLYSARFIMNDSIQNPPSSASKRLTLGGAALAASASAAFALPTAVVLDNPLVVDGTLTTAAPRGYVFNIFDGANAALNNEGPDESFNRAGSFQILSLGNLDDPSKPFFGGIVGGFNDGNTRTTFSLLHDGEGGGKPNPSVGASTLIGSNNFLEPYSAEYHAPAGSDFYAITDDPSSYNAWLTGSTFQYFMPFSITTGETLDEEFSFTEVTYGYLEIAYHAPSVSIALLSYGFETFAINDEFASITTPGEFTAYTPPADFVMTPIPEPSSFALGAALVAGSTALLRRRRHSVAA